MTDPVRDPLKGPTGKATAQYEPILEATSDLPQAAGPSSRSAAPAPSVIHTTVRPALRGWLARPSLERALAGLLVLAAIAFNQTQLIPKPPSTSRRWATTSCTWRTCSKRSRR
jgi:hypothetical protein